MIQEIMVKIKEFPIHAAKKRAKYIANPLKDFTRDRVLNFSVVTLLITHLLKKSLAVEFEELFYKLGEEIPLHFDKSSFSRARLKVNPLFFLDWAKLIWDLYQKAAAPFLKRWNNFLLVGIDGSSVYLFDSEELKVTFGSQTNQFGERVMAHIVVAYDVLNDFIIEGAMDAYRLGERAITLQWLHKVSKDTLLLYDRLFPSVAFFYAHSHLQLNFVMRIKVGFNNQVKAFVASDKIDDIVEFKVTSDARKTLSEWDIPIEEDLNFIQVRLIKVLLDNGELEVLATSLFDQKLYPTEVFKGLYAKRWGSETAYDRLKNKFKMEVISGRTVQAVLQDCFATWFLYNLQSLFIRSLDEPIRVLNEQPQRKRKVQINRNVTLGILKIFYADLLFKKNQAQTIEVIQRKFLEHLTDDIKGSGRQNPRKRRAKRLLGKHQTCKNYAPAI